MNKHARILFTMSMSRQKFAKGYTRNKEVLLALYLGNYMFKGFKMMVRAGGKYWPPLFLMCRIRQ